jgi:predicted phage tail component-like protein
VAFSFSFNGVRADSKDIVVQKVKRCVIPPMTPRTTYVPSRVGEYFYRIDIGPEHIEVDIVISEQTQSFLRTKLADISRWLNPLNGQQQLIFDDEPDVFYWAVLSKDSDLDQLLAIGNTKLIFEIPDGVSHALSQVKFDITMQPPVTFTRASSAWEDITLNQVSSFIPVATGVPRYTFSTYTNGIQIEEGTSNILPALESEGFIGAVWSAVGSGTLISNVKIYTVVSKNVLKVVTPGIVTNEGVASVNQAVLASTTYTFSAYVLGKGTVMVQTVESGGVGTTTNGVATTLIIDQYQRLSITITTVVGTNNVSLKVLTTTEEADIFYCSAFQLEQKAYPTSWQVGTTTARAEEFAKLAPVPPGSKLLGQQGTIDFFFTKTGKPATFGGMFDMGKFSAGPTFDRISIQHGTAIGSGEKSIRLEIDTTGGKQKLCTLTLSSALVVGNDYYLAVRWFLNGSVNGYQKITLGDLTNNVEYNAVVTSTIPPPKFSANSTIYFGSLNNSSFKANCIYSDFRFSIKPRNDTEITDTWKARKPLVKDEFSTIKFTFNKTLNGSQVSNIGSATGYPQLFYNPTVSFSTFWIDVYPGPRRFQINTAVTSSSDFQVNSTLYALFRPANSTIATNTIIAIGSIFPTISGDHYFITNNTGASMALYFTPRFI